MRPQFLAQELVHMYCDTYIMSLLLTMEPPKLLHTLLQLDDPIYLTRLSRSERVLLASALTSAIALLASYFASAAADLTSPLAW